MPRAARQASEAILMTSLGSNPVIIICTSSNSPYRLWKAADEIISMLNLVYY